MRNNQWLEQIFGAKIAKQGGIVRRNKFDVHRYASREMLIEYVKDCGFHLFEIKNQYVVICSRGTMEVIC